MLIGGIAFETPPSDEDLKPAAENAVFALFNSRTKALASRKRGCYRLTSCILKRRCADLYVGAPVTVPRITDRRGHSRRPRLPHRRRTPCDRALTLWYTLRGGSWRM
ncbi:MAG: hypothetical protein MZV70_10820 [Desulfobacterales bacterium]|nr:hypothetical protein [Desulfobacterales bacterium]